MKNYAVFLEGSNFLLNEQGAEKLHGFFITKRIVASSKNEAGAAAIQAVWRDPKIAGQESNVPAPHIEVKVVHELPGSNQMKDTGYVLFEMEAE